MQQRKSRKKIVLTVMTVLAAVIAVILIIKRDVVRMVYHNLVKTEVPLDVSGGWDGGETYKHIQYADVSDSDYLDLYVPDSEKPVPLLILVHGGGFLFGDSDTRQCQLMYQYFRDHGYACASINYRLAGEASYPAAVDDVKAAVRFLKANAEKYGYDPNRIAIWGESAGGYLAVAAGVTEDDEYNGVKFIGEEELEEPVSAKVSAIVDFYGCCRLGQMEKQFRELKIPKVVTSIAASWGWQAMRESGYDSFEEIWLDRPFDELSEEEVDQMSPAWYAEKNLDADSDLAVMIWHGDADITVPYLQSEELAELLTEKLGEDKVSYRLFHNYCHADDLFYSDEALGEVQRFIEKSLS